MSTHYHARSLKTKAILLLLFGGIPCDIDPIMELARKYNLKVIEDCAADVCSTYKGKALGTFGDIGMWSFDAMKILVCGDGAMLHFNTPELREKADKWLYFGLEAKSGYENSVAQKWWEFDISAYGHRAIMNNATVAMAIEQFKKLPELIRKPPYQEATQSIYQYFIELGLNLSDKLCMITKDNWMTSDTLKETRIKMIQAGIGKIIHYPEIGLKKFLVM